MLVISLLSGATHYGVFSWSSILFQVLVWKNCLLCRRRIHQPPTVWSSSSKLLMCHHSHMMMMIWAHSLTIFSNWTSGLNSSQFAINFLCNSFSREHCNLQEVIMSPCLRVSRYDTQFKKERGRRRGLLECDNDFWNEFHVFIKGGSHLVKVTFKLRIPISNFNPAYQGTLCT